MRKEKRYVLLDPPTARLFDRLCESTNRDAPFTLRRIVEMFLAEGLERASDRLNSGLWDEPASQSTASTGIPGSTPDEKADYIVHGKLPTAKGDKSKRKPA